MAVHAANGTLVAATASNVTLTSWQPYVLVTLLNATATAVYITVDGSTATSAGADTTAVNLVANVPQTVALKNLLPRPDLSTTTPLATDPSAVPAFTTAQTKVSLISASTPTYNIELSPNTGTLPVNA